MTTFTEAVSITFEVFTCASCGCSTGVPKGLIGGRIEGLTTSSLHCYNGHENVWQASKLEAAQKAQQAAEASRDFWRREADAEKLRTAAARGQVTKMRNRVGNGVCPCCNRTFVNLQRHMASKHPEMAHPKQEETKP